MSDDGERGSATVWVLALAGALAVVALAAVLVGGAVVARHRAGSAADLAALAAAGRAVLADPGACAVAEEVAAANGAVLERCTVRAGAVVEVEVAVPFRLGPLGRRDAAGRARAGPVGGQPVVPGPSAAASSSRTASSTRTAPALSSGSLPLPHFGDWTHEGQPLSHSQLATVARVACSHSRSTAYPRSAKPAPPGCPS